MSETLSYKQAEAIEESKLYSGILQLKARVKVLEAALMDAAGNCGCSQETIAEGHGGKCHVPACLAALTDGYIGEPACGTSTRT